MNRNPVSLIVMLVAACSPTNNAGTSAVVSAVAPEIIQKPIVFDARREELSIQYLHEHYGIVQDDASIKPTMVVVHWTDIPTMKETFAAFERPGLPPARAAIGSASALNVSSHFLVDRDGTIYQLLPETTMARHVIGLNYCAIGIENVGNGSDLPLTDAQLDSNIALIRYLHAKHGIQYLIGHYEYSQFIGHPLWKEKDPGYRTEKTDPGVEFMRRLRARLNDLGMQGAPERPKASGPNLIDERKSPPSSRRPLTAGNDNPDFRYLEPDGMALPRGSFGLGVVIEPGHRLAFLTGQIGDNADGGLSDDFETQARNALASVGVLLNEAGMNWSDVVKINVYLIAAADIPVWARVRDEIVGDARPSGTGVIVRALANPKARIEVSVIAAQKVE